MKKTPYETVQSFELQTDLQTKVVVEISCIEARGRRRYRAAIFRSFTSSGDGSTRKTPWLGARELALAPGLIRRAQDWIHAQRKLAVAAPATPDMNDPEETAQDEANADSSFVGEAA